MIWLSVGIEQVEDIKADFKQALEQISQPGKIVPTNEDVIQIQEEVNRCLYEDSPRTLDHGTI